MYRRRPTALPRIRQMAYTSLPAASSHLSPFCKKYQKKHNEPGRGATKDFVRYARGRGEGGMESVYVEEEKITKHYRLLAWWNRYIYEKAPNGSSGDPQKLGRSPYRP